MLPETGENKYGRPCASVFGALRVDGIEGVGEATDGYSARLTGSRLGGAERWLSESALEPVDVVGEWAETDVIRCSIEAREDVLGFGCAAKVEFVVDGVSDVDDVLDGEVGKCCFNARLELELP